MIRGCVWKWATKYSENRTIFIRKNDGTPIHGVICSDKPTFCTFFLCSLYPVSPFWRAKKSMSGESLMYMVSLSSNITGWWFEPLWKIWKSVGIIIPNIIYIWKNKKCSKPPTSGFLGENHPCSAHMGHRLSDPTTMSSLYGCWVLVGSGCAWATTLRPKYDSLRMVGVWGGSFTISSWGHAFFWEENNKSQRSEIVG